MVQGRVRYCLCFSTATTTAATIKVVGIPSSGLATDVSISYYEQRHLTANLSPPKQPHSLGDC